jgi:hypothetical protein
MDSWQKLTAILLASDREELALALLEALASEKWHRVDIEIRDHKMHAVNITKRINVNNSENRTKLLDKN